MRYVESIFGVSRVRIISKSINKGGLTAMKRNFLLNIVLPLVVVVATPLAIAEIFDESKPASEQPVTDKKESKVKKPDIEYLKCGDVVKRILFDESANNSPQGPHTLRCYDIFIDFDSGRTYPGPDSNEAFIFDSFEEWLRVKGIDAQAAPGKMYQGFMGYEMLILPTKDWVWDYPGKIHSSGEDFPEHQKHFYEFQMDELKKGRPGSHVPIRAKGELPETFLFRTREDSIGVMQVTGFNVEHMKNSINHKKSVEFRYKIIERLENKEKHEIPNPKHETISKF